MKQNGALRLTRLSRLLIQQPGTTGQVSFLKDRFQEYFFGGDMMPLM